MAKGDALFAKGVKVNPLEVDNLPGRIALHRRYGDWLAQPVSNEEIMRWIMHARSLQPNSDSVQVEYVRCLAFVGQHEQAIEEAERFLKKRPDSRTAKILLNEMRPGQQNETGGSL